MTTTDSAAQAATHEALRWTAGALQALKIEADKITLDGQTRTVGEILDSADSALSRLRAPVALADERALIADATGHVTEALIYVDRVAQRKAIGYADFGTNPRRHHSDTRPYTLKDARQDAHTAAIHLRRAWDVLDPSATPPDAALASASVAQQAGPCTSCSGTGLDGDVCHDGRTIDAQCRRCAGSGTIKIMPTVGGETECQECEGFGVVDCAAPAPDSAPVADERAAFERWYTRHDTPDMAARAVQRDSSGHYRLMAAHSSWDVWQAARVALANAPVAQPLPCASCNGTGADGDVGDDGSTIDVHCGTCSGTGQQPAASAPVAGEARPWSASDTDLRAWAERHGVENILKFPSTIKAAIDDARSLHLVTQPETSAGEAQKPVATLYLYKQKGRWAAHVTGLDDTALNLGSNPVYAAPLASADAEITSYALLGGTRVERVAQPDGTYLWAVRRNGNCLGLDGHWSYEPLPSSRTTQWLALHRFPTAQAAIAAHRRQEGEAC